MTRDHSYNDVEPRAVEETERQLLKKWAKRGSSDEVVS